MTDTDSSDQPPPAPEEPLIEIHKPKPYCQCLRMSALRPKADIPNERL